MGRMSKAKRQERNKQLIAEYEIKKRNGIMRVIVAIVAFVVVTAIKQIAITQGVELASDMWVNMVFYVFVLVLAGVAGFGARDYARAKEQLDYLKSKEK